MVLNLLLVEDEAGIREGLASFLQLKGYLVTTASSCAEGLLRLADGSFDIVVTDWHLGDGLGETIVASCGCPALVISGVTEQVRVPGARVQVIRKPIAPRELAAKLESMVEVVGESDESPVGDSLPVDARDRVDLILALVAASQPPRHKPNVEVLDDGVFVTVTATLDEDDPALHADLLQICSDVRCLDRGGKPVLEARFFLDGRRAESDLSVDPSEDWPAGDAPIAVDFGRGDPCPPARAAEILHMASNASSLGRLVYFTNLPGHLRLYLEVFGNAAAMPIRGLAGPALPEALAELWR